VGELAIYGRIVAARMRSEWQYRTAFVLISIVQLISTGLVFFEIAVLFHNIPRLAGWSLAEVGLLYGIAGVAFALGDTFASQVERAEFHIRAGSFDSFLIRPLGPMLQLCAHEFLYRRILKAVPAVVVLAVAGTRVGVAWTPRPQQLQLVTIASGALIFSALWVIYCSMSFWVVANNELVYAAVSGGEIAARFPLDLFTGWLRRWFTGVMPIGFVAYYPSLWLLGRSTPHAGALRFASPLVASVLVLIARAVWRSGIRHYRGTGS
jgi:ABC-2 type transport system permease protein